MLKIKKTANLRKYRSKVSRNNMKNSKSSTPLKGILLAVLCNILFGIVAPFIKLAYECFEIGENVFDTVLFAGVRFFGSGLLVLLFTIIIKHRFPVFKKENAKNVFPLAFIYIFLQYVFFFIAVSRASGTSVSVLNSSSVFLAVIFAHFAYKDDRMNYKKVIGVILGFAGVLFAVLSGGSMGGFSFLGEGFVFITAIWFVIGTMINKKAMKIDDFFTVTSYNFLMGSVLLIIFGLICGGRLRNINLKGILVLLLLSASSAISVCIWSWLVKNFPLGKISVFNFINPVTGVFLSAILLGENIFRWQYLLALVLVSVGIIAVNHKKE